MKQRHTLVCALSVLALIGSAEADENASLVHSGIGTIPPRELLSSHILELPAEEQSSWIHGAVSATAQALAANSTDQAGCVIGWYFEGNGPQVIQEAFEAYQTANATSVIYTLATNVCPED